MQRHSRRARSERGAAAVEFALITPLLLLLVFGIVDFGWMTNRDMLIDNATRDGARVASLGGSFQQTCTSVRTEIAASGLTAPASCNAQTSPVKITIDCVKADGSACRATASTYDSLAVSGATTVVTIDYLHSWITPMLPTVLGSSTHRIVETTQMVVE